MILSAFCGYIVGIVTACIFAARWGPQERTQTWQMGNIAGHSTAIAQMRMILELRMREKEGAFVLPMLCDIRNELEKVRRLHAR